MYARSLLLQQQQQQQQRQRAILAQQQLLKGGNSLDMAGLGLALDGVRGNPGAVNSRGTPNKANVRLYSSH